jgi:hypothetical protein
LRVEPRELSEDLDLEADMIKRNYRIVGEGAMHGPITCGKIIENTSTSIYETQQMKNKKR